MQDSIEKIVKNINENGFYATDNFFSKDHIKHVYDVSSKGFLKPSINGQKGYVKTRNIQFLQNTLSYDKKIIDIYTDSNLINIVDQYIDGKCHLSNYRIYKSEPDKNEKMHWHTDNKTDKYVDGKFVTNTVSNDKGIICITYLSDVADGGFQIVKKSHNWAYKKESWNDSEDSFKDDIITFNNLKAGFTVIYDYRCIHRAKPYQDGKDRMSLFGQFSPEMMPVGEPILLSSEHINDLSDKQKRVLNFGKKPSTENWPIGEPDEVIALKTSLKVLRNSIKSFFIS